ncbi:unnamed protein product [Bursaphelenchus xylophilus]|uniref:(pine wood nematode) hypothetical protein n=1 Tax=Bursaphelenchus xylophilus TaxID=6326 RepID=A0A1I7SRB3_BURXY|nr:unnamed protein product [Bursaphelenchus xylophilus]CAG9102663.1 unnamed protein product [Bursaphelenchus xylophilus]
MPDFPHGTLHLRRVFDSRNSPINNKSESKCQLILLAVNTLLGRQVGRNHVVLHCSHPKQPGFIRNRHAFIRAKLDNTGSKVLYYEICPFPLCDVRVNNQLIDRFTRININDLISLGNGFGHNHCCYHFRIERADSRLPYPLIRANLTKTPREMRGLHIYEGCFEHRAGDLNHLYASEKLLLTANRLFCEMSRNDENLAPSQCPLTAGGHFRPPPDPVTPIGLMPSQQMLVDELVNQLMQQHQIQQHIIPAVNQMNTAQIAVVREYIKSQQLRRLLLQVPQLAIGGLGRNSPLLAGTVGMQDSHSLPNFNPETRKIPSFTPPSQLPMLFVDQIVPAETAQSFMNSAPYMATASTSSQPILSETRLDSSNISSTMGAQYVRSRENDDSDESRVMPKHRVDHEGKDDDNNNEDENSHEEEHPGPSMTHDNRERMKAPTILTSECQKLPQGSETNPLDLSFNSEVLSEISVDLVFSKDNFSESPAMLLSPSSSSEHASFECSFSKPASVFRSHPKASHSMEYEEDEEPLTKPSIEQERRRMKKYITNNFYFHLYKESKKWKSRQNKADSDDEWIRYAGLTVDRCTKDSLYKEDEIKREEEESEGVINRPKPFIDVNEGQYEKQQAQELRKKLLEESELRKTYPSLQYPDIPNVTDDEAETKLLATLLISLKPDDADNGSICTTEISEDQISLLGPEEAQQRPAIETDDFSTWTRSEDLKFKKIDKQTFVFPGTSRQIASKYRRLFRAEVDCTSTENMLIQRNRLRKKHEADQQKMEELNKKKYKLKKTPVSTSSARRGRQPGKKVSGADASTLTPSTPLAPPSSRSYKRPSLTHSKPKLLQKSVSTPCSISQPQSHLHSKTSVPSTSTAKSLEPQKPATAFLREAPGAEFMMRPAVILNAKYNDEDVDVNRIVQSIQSAVGQLESTSNTPQERVKRKYTKRKHKESKSGSDAVPKKHKKRGPKPRKDSLNSSASYFGRKPSKKQIAAETQKRLEIDLGLVDEKDFFSSSDGSFILPANEIEEPCALQACRIHVVLREAERSAIEWVQCDVCDKWFHCICALQTNRPVGKREVFRCRQADCPSSSADFEEAAL